MWRIILHYRYIYFDSVSVKSQNSVKTFGKVKGCFLFFVFKLKPCGDALLFHQQALACGAVSFTGTRAFLYVIQLKLLNQKCYGPVSLAEGR